MTVGVAVFLRAFRGFVEKLKISNRQFGRLKGAEYSYLLTKFREARTSRLELERDASRKGSKLAGLLRDHGMYWWQFYDLPFAQHLALFFHALGLDMRIVQIGNNEKPVRAMLEFMRDDGPNEENPLEKMTGHGQVFVVNLTISTLNSLEAYGHYSCSINDLLSRAMGGDKQSLLHALSIDRTVIGSDATVSAIASAQLSGNKRYLSGLFRRIKDPHYGRRTYVDLRFMREVLEEAGALGATGGEDLLDLVQDQLGLYKGKVGENNSARVRFAVSKGF